MSLETELAENIYKNLVRTAMSNTRLGDTIHISDLTLLCSRAVWLGQRHNYEFRPKVYVTKEQALAFEYGRILQQMVSAFSTDLISKWVCLKCKKAYYVAGLLNTKECCGIPLISRDIGMKLEYKNFSIRGNVDVILKHGKKCYIADIKTIKSESFDKLSEPITNHVRQVCGYLWMHNQKETEKDKVFDYVDKSTAFLVYLRKDMQKLDFKIFPVERNTYNTEKRIEKFLKEISSKTIPKIACASKLSPEAKACNFTDICFEEEKNESKNKQAKRKKTSEKNSREV